MKKVKTYFKTIGKNYKTQKRAKMIKKHQIARIALEKDVNSYKIIYGDLLSRNLIEDKDIANWLKFIKHDPHCNEAFTHHPAIVAERNAILVHKEEGEVTRMRI